MGTKRRPSKRNNYQKQEAISFLSNITLGNENERLSSDDSHELNDIRNIINYPEKRMKSETSNRSLSSSEITFYKLKGEDSQRLIASEKIKRKSDNSLNDNEQHNRAGIVSYFRYYRGILSKPKKKVTQHYSYVHERLINRHIKHRHVISYSHFLSNNTSTTTYNPYYLNMDDVSQISKQEINETFQLLHPEIVSEMTFSKIKSVKLHLLNIAKVLDLELSSLSHAFVYFEKLLQKNIITKQNRKLIAACCLYLAVKINEPKGVCFKDLLDTIHEEFDIGSKELKENEFAVFADLEFNLYVPVAEFMPHFDKLLVAIGHQSIEDYIGNETFYEINA